MDRRCNCASHKSVQDRNWIKYSSDKLGDPIPLQWFVLRTIIIHTLITARTIMENTGEDFRHCAVSIILNSSFNYTNRFTFIMRSLSAILIPLLAKFVFVPEQTS